MEISEIGVAVVGSVDSGKSTLIGTLISNKLDDGNGLNRSIVSGHNHEINSGKTSSISVHSMKKYQGNNSVILIDLCGHEKYLKTTLYGIMGYYPDYAIVIIGANRGILQMTREHTKILHHLKIPMIIALTKIDLIENICMSADKNPEEMLNNLVSDIKKIYAKGSYNVKDMNVIEEQKGLSEVFTIIPNTTQIPLFKISSKTGRGLDLFKSYISKLPKNKMTISCPLADQILIKSNKKISQSQTQSQTQTINPFIFYVEKVYCPNGIGWVATGILRCSDPNTCLSVGTTCFLGPSSEQINIKVWSIHNYYKEKTDKIFSGQRACLAVRSDKKLTYKMFRKGSILTNNLDILKYASYKYKATIKLLSHPSTVRDNFSPVIHCATIRQSAKITILEITNKRGKKQDISQNQTTISTTTTTTTTTDSNRQNDDNKHIYPGDMAIICLEFKFYPEIIEPNENFFLREGLCLGVGTILEPIY
jgi:elongation factor 1-alpha